VLLPLIPPQKQNQSQWTKRKHTQSGKKRGAEEREKRGVESRCSEGVPDDDRFTRNPKVVARRVNRHGPGERRGKKQKTKKKKKAEKELHTASAGKEGPRAAQIKGSPWRKTGHVVQKGKKKKNMAKKKGRRKKGEEKIKKRQKGETKNGVSHNRLFFPRKTSPQNSGGGPPSPPKVGRQKKENEGARTR